MWTETTRPKYERAELRYASDLTDAEWDVIGPLLPATKRLGRPRTTVMREVVNAILYMVRWTHYQSHAPVSVFRSFEPGIRTWRLIPCYRSQFIPSILGSLAKTFRSNERRCCGNWQTVWMPVERM